MKFSDLWRWDGLVSRATYSTVGLVGVAIKHNLDRLIASSFLDYWNSFNEWGLSRRRHGWIISRPLILDTKRGQNSDSPIAKNSNHPFRLPLQAPCVGMIAVGRQRPGAEPVSLACRENWHWALGSIWIGG